jgi:hypothetical protein
MVWVYWIMYVFYIPWISCEGYNFLLMLEINWIKCMGGWMSCCHKRFAIMKKGKKRINNFFKKDLVYGQYTNACKLGAIWDGQDFNNQKSWSQQKTIVNFSLFVGSSKWSLVLDFKFYINQRCNIWVKFIAC